MAAEVSKDKKSSIKPITEDQRFRYIGFEVFPGKVKDLFKTDDEREKYIDGVRKKRQKGDTLRDQCTLLEERISTTDRIVLTIASVVILATLFIPWYSVYNEKVEVTREAVTEQAAVPTDSVMSAVTGDDTLAATAQAAGAMVAPAPVTEEQGDEVDKQVASRSAAEEVISGYVAKKKVVKEYHRLWGIGSIIGLGSIGSYVFSSGGVIILSAMFMLIYLLLCVGLPVYTLYGIYGLKGDADQKALQLKKMLRFNWVPVILFLLVIILSFLGGEYGSDAASVYSSLGDSYGPGALLGMLSWGILISLGGFILVAVKGIEI